MIRKQIYSILFFLQICFGYAFAQQEQEVPTSAGTDFFFTILNHWCGKPNTDSQQLLHLNISATEAATITVSTVAHGQIASIHLSESELARTIDLTGKVSPLEAVYVHSTAPCYLYVWVHGNTSSAESAILPEHLLGTKYMLQSWNGTKINLDGEDTETFAQFVVVGTTEKTPVVVSAPDGISLQCVTTGTSIQAGESNAFIISKNEVFLFQPERHTATIGGTIVSSDEPVAVFQGNTITEISSSNPEPDYVWEQARPTEAWGTNFIIPQCRRLAYSHVLLLALYDNTEVYVYENGQKHLKTTLNSGKRYALSIFDERNNLVTEHVETSAPACCYLFTTGSTLNNGLGDPGMAEIVPVDRGTTEARWKTSYSSLYNTPYSSYLYITTKKSNESAVFLNDRPLTNYITSGDGALYIETDDYVTYEIPRSASSAGVLTSRGDDISAYMLKLGKTAEASLFNISLPNIPYKAEPLCMDGKLLFREDFGGNSPDDPKINASASVPGMSSSYQNGGGTHMGSGTYMIGKKGYKNNIQWHRQDDHTFPNDTTRGYLLEVDGSGGAVPFYSKTIDNLCAGTKLTFSAYVVNVTYAGQIPYLQANFSYVYPRMKFVLVNPATGDELASKSTGDIKADERYSTEETWKYARENDISAEWQLVGMNFTVPQGVESIQMYIYNDVSGGGSGNDFALDDIEIHACLPQVTISATDSVCVHTKNILKAEFENNGTFVEPLEYQWFFSQDSSNWLPVAGETESELKFKAQLHHSGWYQVAVAGAGGIEFSNCRSTSSPFKLHVINDCPPVLCPEGKLLFHEDFESKITSGEAQVENLCAGLNLSFIVNLPPSHPQSRLMIRLTDRHGTELAAYDTGDIPSDSTRVGTTYPVPAGVNTIRCTVSNNAPGAIGSSFSIDNMEIRLCVEPITISSTIYACRKKPHTFRALYDNYGVFESPEYRWYFSPDSISWNVVQTGSSNLYTIPIIHRSNEGWYRVSVAEEGNNELSQCRSESNPFRLITNYCQTAVELQADTTVCDTLLPLLWRGYEWYARGERIDTIRDHENDDSLYIHLSFNTISCCPDIKRENQELSQICDTLMPYTWLFRDTAFVFYDVTDIRYMEIKHPKWNCIDSMYVFRIDTIHCEKLWPVIVNKYNWVLLCDNIQMQRFFPGRTTLAYQWYKNGEAIPGAVEDDYSESNELRGRYQLRIEMDEGQTIWSNVIYIADIPARQPLRVRIYDSRGRMVKELETTDEFQLPPLSSGIYLIRFEQSVDSWTQKIIIP